MNYREFVAVAIPLLQSVLENADPEECWLTLSLPGGNASFEFNKHSVGFDRYVSGQKTWSKFRICVAVQLDHYANYFLLLLSVESLF